MQHVFFIFGKTPSLSRAELKNTLNSQKINFTETSGGAFYTHLEISCGLADLPRLQDRLGGVVKSGEVLDVIPVSAARLAAIKTVLTANSFAKMLPESENKVTFGWSLYAHDGKPPHRLFQQLKRHGLEIKKHLRAEGRKVQFVSTKNPELSSVAVTKEKMIERGVELCVFLEKERVIIGRTKTVQDFKAYSERDYGRPAHDDVSGMLPPKLAQMMINLAGVPTSATLLDPFCGSGTVLLEALNMGFRNVVGSDISEKAVDDSQANVEWFEKKLEVSANVALYHQDAANLTDAIEPESIDAICTEPYLGPPLKGGEVDEQLQKTIAQLEPLYKKWIHQAHKVLRKGGRLVMVVPHFQTRGKRHSLNLDFNGFTVDHVEGATLAHGGLIYKRPDQHITREIVVATKTR